MTVPTEPPAGADAPAPAPPARRRGPVRALLRWLGPVLLVLAMPGMLLWATLAVYFADTHAGPRPVPAILYALASLAAAGFAAFLRPRWRGLAAFALLFLAVLAWYLALSPSNDRDWAPDVARTPWATIAGDRLTLHNVRNFDYRTESDYTARWDDRSYDLSNLRTVDLILTYWGSPDIAHVMVSFGFDDGQYLAVSVEARRERPESYSSVQGFFRQFELVYVFADERDVVRLRTNYRKGEEVYVYRTAMTPAQARAALASYLGAANALHERPEWYNALTSNCANNVLEHARAGNLPGRFSLNVLLSGRAARQAYANGVLDSSLPFDELERRGHVNAAARAADRDPNFSTSIRAGLPVPASVAAGAPGKPAPAPRAAP